MDSSREDAMDALSTKVFRWLVVGLALLGASPLTQRDGGESQGLRVERADLERLVPDPAAAAQVNAALREFLP
jgi:hypothetical protein